MVIIESKVSPNPLSFDIITSKKVIMATKAANRIKDKWAEQGFEISESQPYVDSFYNKAHDWSMLLTRQNKHPQFPEENVSQDTINIIYHVYSKLNVPNFTITAYHTKGLDESQPFYWNEYLLSLLNEQMNCIDDAICILEHSEEMLANG